MALIIKDPVEPHFGAEVLAAWQDIPTTIISDELNRSGTVGGAIRPLSEHPSFIGEALTVETMVADNAALHYAVPLAWPGAAMMIDAGGHVDAAVWGGIIQMAAEARGVVGVVVDGAVRDGAELRRAKAPVFARATVPAGPHKGFGGAINVPIQCGGCPVMPGDLIRGDEDGVAVVPRAQVDELLPRCRARMAKEEEIIAGLRAGKTTVELLNLPPPEAIG